MTPEEELLADAEKRRQPFTRRDRCVECGQSRSMHTGEELLCRSDARSTYKTLNLPEGKTCADCVHTTRCCSIFGHVPADETCDFFPIRFRARKPAEVPACQPA